MGGRAAAVVVERGEERRVAACLLIQGKEVPDVALEAVDDPLGGEDLSEVPVAVPLIPPADLPDKIKKIQALLPAWIERHGSVKVKPLVDGMERHLQLQEFEQASSTD